MGFIPRTRGRKKEERKVGGGRKEKEDRRWEGGRVAMPEGVPQMNKTAAVKARLGEGP